MTVSRENNIYLVLSLLTKSTVPVPWYSDGNAFVFWNSTTEWLTYLYTNGILLYTPRYSDAYYGILIVNAEIHGTKNMALQFF